MKTIGELQTEQRMLDLQEERVSLFRDQGDTRNRIIGRHPWHLWLIGCLICLSILAGAGEISKTLDEVCPTVDEGTQFLHARTG